MKQNNRFKNALVLLTMFAVIAGCQEETKVSDTPVETTPAPAAPSSGSSSASSSASASSSNSSSSEASSSSSSSSSTPAAAPATPATPANSAPQLDGPATATAAENAAVSVQLVGSDVDNDTLTYSCSGCPSGYTLGAMTGLFGWSPGYSDSGTYTPTFSVTDGTHTTTKTVTITITNVNRAPSVTAMSAQSVAEGATLTFTPTVSDPDGQSVTTTASGLPTNASFNGTVFTFSPSYTQSGSYSITITTSDGSLTDSKVLSVSVGNTNRAPTLNPIGPKNYSEGDSFVFTISASDPDGQSVTLSASNLPPHAGVTWSTVTGEFGWMTACTYEGTYPVTFSASDGSLTTSETVVMTIAHRDCAIPTWNTDPVIVSQSGANITVTIGAAVDPDGTAITYGYLREYDCMNRNWTETWDSTLKRISVTHPYATSSSNYHYFLTYAQDADGSRNYQYVILLYPGAPYTGYTLGKAVEGATLTTNVCGGGTLFNWGPN